MKIDVSVWREFIVGELFACSTTKPMIITEKGAHPYVTRSALNNGISDYVSDINYTLNKGNCITIGAEGKTAFYQNKTFVSGVKIYTLRHNALNSYNALFICTVLNANLCKYNYGRARILQKIKEEIIKLHSTAQGFPDWGNMEQYIKSLQHKPITTTIPAKVQPQFIPVDKWGEFTLGELFYFVKGKRLTKEDMSEGSTNYLGAISENNGIRQLINAPAIFKENCITVNYNGSVGEAFYQSAPFWAADDVNVLYASGWTLNKYIALFIAAVIKANRYKFSYGRKWTMEKMKKSLVKLPVTPQGLPDFDYMEQYIKSLPYSDRI